MTKLADSLQRARSQGYIVARRDGQGQRLARRWWADCGASGRPYVRVVPRQRWAAVEVDMDPTGRELSPTAQERVRGALVDVLKGLPSGKREWYGGDSCIGVLAVPLDKAEPLAAELARIAVDDLAQGEGAERWN